MPGVSHFTATSLACRVGRVERFPRAHSLANYWGLTPGCRNSGENTQRLGSITKDGSQLALATDRIEIWDLNAAKVRLRLRGHTQRITSIAWHPQDQRLVSVGGDQRIKVWDTIIGEEMVTPPRSVCGSEGGVWSLYRFNANGTPDTSFGNQGVVTTVAPGGPEAAVLYPNAGTPNDGKIVAIGQGSIVAGQQPLPGLLRGVCTGCRTHHTAQHASDPEHSVHGASPGWISHTRRLRFHCGSPRRMKADQ
jgi:hypothetical protein